MHFHPIDAVIHHSHDVPGKRVGLGVHARIPGTANDLTAVEKLTCKEERKKERNSISNLMKTRIGNRRKTSEGQIIKLTKVKQITAGSEFFKNKKIRTYP